MEASSDSSDLYVPARRAEQRRTTRPLILCVEDNEDSRALYAAFLTRAGFRVAEAENGELGLQMAKELHPDLIVLDISLPIMDGREMLTLLRAHEVREVEESGPMLDELATRRTPVIVVTAQEYPGHWRDSIDRDCEAYLRKPCPLGDMLAAVLRAISLHRAPPSRPSQA